MDNRKHWGDRFFFPVEFGNKHCEGGSFFFSNYAGDYAGVLRVISLRNKKVGYKRRGITPTLEHKNTGVFIMFGTSLTAGLHHL